MRTLQALVYDILPPTTAISDSAAGLEKLSTNGQFFVGAQMAVTDNSNYSRRLVYNRPRCLRQQK